MVEWIWKAALLTSTSSRPNALTVRSTALTAIGALRNVARDRYAAASFGLDSLLRQLCVPAFVQVEDRDIRALARKQHGDCTADAGIAAGDQRDLAFELLRPEVERCIVERRRLDLRFMAGFGVMLRRKGRRGIFSRAQLRRPRLLRRRGCILRIHTRLNLALLGHGGFGAAGRLRRLVDHWFLPCATMRPERARARRRREFTRRPGC